jgi:hypothetical protein
MVDPPIYLYAGSVNWNHLSTRAWAVQERLLSPRTIHFSRTDTFWECQEQTASSRFPDKLPEQLCLHSSYHSQATLYSMWDKVRIWYLKGNLTKPSDKLIALSGVARKAQASSGGRYVAGMWQTNLENQLNWTVTTTAQRRPPFYQAPTVSIMFSQV